MTDQPAKALPTPCATCPYRLNVPSGVWDAEEYAKLPAYDADTMAQPAALFMCHQRNRCVCSGWLGCGDDPGRLLAVRFGLLRGTLDPSVVEYQTDVPLHPTHTAAARHGLAAVSAPGRRARTAMAKLRASREARDGDKPR